MRILLIAVLGVMVLPAYAQVQLEPMNINHMNRGYFYASAPVVKQYAGFGGWGGSDNEYKPFPQEQAFEENRLSIQIDTSSIVSFYGYKGYQLIISNATTDTLFFDAQDSRLDMIIQARNKFGIWQDIEYLSNSWCGNSYHTLYLPEQHYWAFRVPKYEGKQKTKLRAKLLYKTKPSGKAQVMYSHTFLGSVNKGQFSKKKPYTPRGIMDPYDQ
ncbi:MAG: hypothetical protein KTR13_01725 [Saprospiraceae bacterium]|nr:hypothetical protein [Saprospiraceae bacterium]